MVIWLPYYKNGSNSICLIVMLLYWKICLDDWTDSVHGYFPWSAQVNFEWMDGYGNRLGSYMLILKRRRGRQN